VSKLHLDPEWVPLRSLASNVLGISGAYYAPDCTQAQADVMMTRMAESYTAERIEATLSDTFVLVGSTDACYVRTGYNPADPLRPGQSAAPGMTVASTSNNSANRRYGWWGFVWMLPGGFSELPHEWGHVIDMQWARRTGSRLSDDPRFADVADPLIQAQHDAYAAGDDRYEWGGSLFVYGKSNRLEFIAEMFKWSTYGWGPGASPSREVTARSFIMSLLGATSWDQTCIDMLALVDSIIPVRPTYPTLTVS